MRPKLVCPTRWPERPTRWQALGDALRRLQLRDVVHGADINAQLQRAGADERRQASRLELLLQQPARLPRYTAMVGAEGPVGAEGKHPAVTRQSTRCQYLGAARWHLL